MISYVDCNCIMFGIVFCEEQISWVDTLEAAVWSLATTDSFENALLKAVNLGDDTDTVGAIAGGLAGLYYQTISKAWTDALQRREWIENLIEETEHALHSV